MAVPAVVDTSAWIEWLTASAQGWKLGQRFPDKAGCIVPTIVQIELSKWLLREAGEEQADQGTAYTLQCAGVPLGTTPRRLPSWRPTCTVSTGSPPPTPSPAQRPGRWAPSC